jgi:hypothetical protein
LSGCKPPIASRAPRQHSGSLLREGGKASPLSAAVSGHQEARCRRRTVKEARCVVLSLGAQLHPPSPGHGVGGGDLGHLQHRRSTSYKEVLLRQSSTGRQEGMCLSPDGNVTAQRPEVSKEAWQVVKCKHSKSSTWPQVSETCQ